MMKLVLFRKSVVLLLVLSFSQNLWANVFNSVDGFSAIQGANGWSYAGVETSLSGDLDGNMYLAQGCDGTSWFAAVTYQAGNQDSVIIKASSQMQNEGGLASVRYWTADQNYATVDVDSTLNAIGALGVWIAFYDSETGVQTQIGDAFWASDADGANPVPGIYDLSKGSQDYSLLNNVTAGDRIYFVMQNTGNQTPSGNWVMQDWTQVVTATVPEPATLLCLGLGFSMLCSKRRK